MRDLPRRELSFIDQATILVRVTREMAATADEIWAELVDAPSWPEWMSAVGRARWVSAVPHGEGSRREVTTGPITFLEEFIAWEPEQHFAFSIVGVDGVGSQVIRGGVEMVDLVPGTVGHTVVTYTLAIDAAGPKAVVQPIAGAGTNVVLTRALASLEQRIVAARV